MLELSLSLALGGALSKLGATGARWGGATMRGARRAAAKAPVERVPTSCNMRRPSWYCSSASPNCRAALSSRISVAR
jgi:hypothetical protein